MKRSITLALVGAAALLVLVSAQAMRMTGIPAPRIDTDPHIKFVGYDATAGALLIQGSGLIDIRFPVAPAVRVGGKPAEVVSYSATFVAVRLPALPAGDRTVAVSRSGIGARYAVWTSTIADALWVSARQSLTLNEQRVRSRGSDAP